ncbi:hypothetical protein ACLOJK_037799 [Asimina triloba]
MALRLIEDEQTAEIVNEFTSQAADEITPKVGMEFDIEEEAFKFYNGYAKMLNDDKPDCNFFLWFDRLFSSREKHYRNRLLKQNRELKSENTRAKIKKNRRKACLNKAMKKNDHKPLFNVIFCVFAFIVYLWFKMRIL